MNQRSVYPSSRALTGAMTMALLISTCAVINAQSLLSNGNFEDVAGVFQGWSTNAGVSVAAEAISGNYSARIGPSTANSGNALNQTVSDLSLSQYTLSFDFATSDSGSSSARSMQLSLRTTPGVDSGNINLRIVEGSAPGLGTVQVFGGAWNNALVDAVNLSTSETGAGFLVNTLSIQADYTGTPSYTITVNGNTSANLSSFQGSAPVSGTPLQQVSFQSGNLAAGSWAVVDDLSLTTVPEPADWQLLGLALLSALAWRGWKNSHSQIG